MKKLLLTTSALAALALVTVPAKADVTMSAAFGTGYTFASSDLAGTTNDYNKDGFYTDAEVHAKAEKDIAIGKAGVKVEFKANADGANDTATANGLGSFGGGEIDESSVYLSGGWGRIDVGNEDGAEDSRIHGYSSNTDGMTDNFNFGKWVDSTGANQTAKAAAFSAQSDTSDAAKLTYTTPTFSGVSAKVSYTPAVSDGTTTTTAGSVASPNYRVTNQYGYGLLFNSSVNGVTLAGSAVYSTADVVAETTDATTGLVPVFDGKTSMYGVGGSVALSGFQVLAGYYVNKIDDSATTEDETKNLSLGANYTMGATKVLASWTRNDLDDGQTTTSDAVTTELSLGVVYTLGEGVSVGVGVTDGNWDVNTGTDQDYQIVDLGLNLSF